MNSEIALVQQVLFGRYQVTRELGRGGMATVYLAHDLRHTRDVAIKVLGSALSALLGRERFLREIAVTARLNHPHIVPLLDSGEAGGLLYYVMPFVDGESLRDRLRRERQLPLPDAIAIGREVADALEYAHDAGVVHRDVKPENILLAGGHARLADFGIVRIADSISESDGDSLTATGVAIGTTVYMSPEQAGGGVVDCRTDIYSLGAVAYEMLAGQPPHTGATVEAMLTRKLREPIPSLRMVRETVPPAVDEAIRKAMARLPADRFSTARQFSDNLAAGLREQVGPASVTLPLSEAETVAHEVRRSPFRSRRAVLAWTAVGLAVGSMWFLNRDSDQRWLVREALPQIEEYLDVADFESAFALAGQIKARLPESAELAELWPRLSWRVSIPTEPSGAKVSRQGYHVTGDTWEVLGQTPLTNIRIPYGLSKLRFELDGYATTIRVIGGQHLNWTELRAGDPDALLVGPETFKLDKEGSLPSGMIRVPGGSLTDPGGTLQVGDFFLGRHEVTNAEYKAFVDARGYERPEFWDPIVINRKVLGFAEAVRGFTDRTGRAGPSTWEAGDHAEGQADWPVSGVSWYEAAAFARFSKRELPTAHHWQQALANSLFPSLLPASNFSGKGPRSVLEGRAMSHVEAFDLAGNVREWTRTTIGDERVILGGSWSDPYYFAGTGDSSAPPGDRSPANGFRLATTNDASAVEVRLGTPLVRTTVSQGADVPPATDDVFRAYGRIFDYRRGPLNASVEATTATRIWRRERIGFDAGYRDERMLLYLYLPAAGSAPFQTVVYWPGWDTFALDDIDEYFSKQLDFIVKSGRAVAFPIYRGIFERRNGAVRRRPPFNTAEYRDNAIDGVKDLRRTLDYLETRPELDARSTGFFGYSWGGVNGPIALAHEPRLRVAVIDIGLLPPMSATPEVDPVNALPRVRQPTLMLSGEFDAMVPMANARRYFSLIGVSAADKRHVIVPGGHFIPRELLIREALDWFDKRLGPARR